MLHLQAAPGEGSLCPCLRPQDDADLCASAMKRVRRANVSQTLVLKCKWSSATNCSQAVARANVNASIRTTHHHHRRQTEAVHDQNEDRETATRITRMTTQSPYLRSPTKTRLIHMMSLNCAQQFLSQAYDSRSHAVASPPRPRNIHLCSHERIDHK
jgi:hypothetical protein